MDIRGFLKLIVFVLEFTLASIILLYAVDTPFKHGIIGMYRKHDFVDVYYQSDSILAGLEGSYSRAEWTVKNYNSNDFNMNIFADKDMTILCDGMTIRQSL